MNPYREAAAPFMEAQPVDPMVDAPSTRGVAGVERRHQPAIGSTPPADPAGLSPSVTTGSAGSALPAVRTNDVDRHRARAALAALHKALETWEADIDRLADDRDLYALADGYSALDEFLRAARDVRNHAEDHIARLMEQDRVNLDDEITLERHRNRTRKQWQSHELLRHLVGDQVVDPRTGECVFDVLVSCLPIVPSLSWRTGALREHGVNPDDWCQSEPSRTTVTVRSRKADT